MLELTRVFLKLLGPSPGPQGVGLPRGTRERLCTVSVKTTLLYMYHVLVVKNAGRTGNSLKGQPAPRKLEPQMYSYCP